MLARRPSGSPSFGISLSIGLAATAVATLVRWAADPFFANRVPYMMFFLAVAVAALWGGWRSGLVATFSSVLAADYFFTAPRFQFSFTDRDVLISEIFFVIVCSFICFVGDLRLKQNHRISQLLEEAHRELEEKKAAEHAFSESEAKFRAVAETSSTAIYIHDGQRLLYVNPAAEKITGYSREELYNLDMWSLVHPDFRQIVAERARARFQNQASPQRYEYKILHKDGHEVWLDFGATVIDYDGKKCILANAFDVTARKLAEEALIRSEKLASAGRLAATIAHEINNPLEAVTNLLYLARTDSAGASQYIAAAESELRRVSHIARQTLGFYRDRGTPQEVGVSDLVNDVLTMYAKRIESKGLLVTARLDDTMRFTTSSGELRQIVSNLVSNSVDALEVNGALAIQVRRTHHPRTAEPGIRITVSDTGPGIPAETRNKIFEAFFTTKRDVGTGLGLWVTRNLVEKNGGSIRMKTSVNPASHGTTFSIFLPVAYKAKVEDSRAVMAPGLA
jgi:PAS domain S-box-containing protein